MLQYEYARSALQIGLQLERELGVNPYKFGMIGSTDSHTGSGHRRRGELLRQALGRGARPQRWEHPMAKRSDDKRVRGYLGHGRPSGYAAVWATENTREAHLRRHDAQGDLCHHRPANDGALLWRLGVRSRLMHLHRLPADIGYTKGVPMGGDLVQEPGLSAQAPSVPRCRPQGSFLVGISIGSKSSRDGWTVRASGREKVYDVAWSGDRSPGADGKLPPVGNTVDVADATWTNTIGAPELITVWKDPDFDPNVPAVYYARVLEIPTPRWTAYEAEYYGITMLPEVPMITQERAYTSPIWYTPSAN